MRHIVSRLVTAEACSQVHGAGKMINFKAHLQSFFSGVAKGEAEIYNEFSLQHEYGIYLRATFGSTFKVQFERPVSFFGLVRSGFIKKEIDIVTFTPNLSEKYAFELKFPRSGNIRSKCSRLAKIFAFLSDFIAAALRDVIL